MNVAVVLGAGSSAAEAASHRPDRTKQHPPLDTNFFSKVKQLGLTTGRRTISSFAVEVGLPDPFGLPEPRMEEFFGDLYFEVVESAGDRQQSALAAYRALLRTYTATLAQTTNWFHNRPTGAVGRYLRELLTRGPSSITLVTFNHDIALENAVVQLPRLQRWCVDRGYGTIALEAIPTNRGGVARLPRHDDNVCNHEIPIEILKLHGSLNWQVETRSHDPSYADLFPTPQQQRTVQCIIDREVSVTLSRRHGRRRWRLWPQIAPPIYEKQSIIAARFGSLWTQASTALELADEITFIGYSFPATDAHASNLIKRAVRRNPRVSEVSVVNPDPTLPGRVASLTGVDSILWHRSLDSYTHSLSR